MKFAGVARLKILKAGDSKVLSLLTLYLIIPCVIINAFQVDFSQDIKGGLLLALCAAVIIQLGTIFFSWLLKKTLKLDPVEQCSAVYSNAANLIIPLISAMLGEEWVIFTCPFTASQLFLIWSHGKSVLCGERGFSLKKVLTNTNRIPIVVDGQFRGAAIVSGLPHLDDHRCLTHAIAEYLHTGQ